jgi:hypothetical protein
MVDAHRDAEIFRVRDSDAGANIGVGPTRKSHRFRVPLNSN